MTGPRANLLDLVPAKAEELLRAFASSRGVAPYRGSQATRHLWAAPKPTFDAMTDLPKEFRALLDAHFEIPRLRCTADQTSADGTRKFLFMLADGQSIETVA
ncbi:MAG: 23S rRNA (adenine(2503)-C(2))-methyltransferase RlmN, partial [Gemmatimonadales bacterium]